MTENAKRSDRRETDLEMKITVSHRLPLDVAQWVQDRADALGTSKSEVLRMALVAAMAADAKQAAA